MNSTNLKSVTNVLESSSESSARLKSQEKPGESNRLKRFIPEHKKPDSALTFPEKLMDLMKMADKQDNRTYCIAWLPDGKSFVIRNPEEFTRKILLKFFKATKFSSFTRKLYRWGFRQTNRGVGPDDPIIFGNEHFQRDNEELMANMRSVTAASSRKEIEGKIISTKNEISENQDLASPLDAELERRRALVELLHLHSTSASSLHRHSPLFGCQTPHLSLTPRATGYPCLSVYDVLGQSMRMRTSLLGAPASQYPPPGLDTTTDILKAAINALRYAP